MNDSDLTKEELTKEILELRERIGVLESLEIRHRQMEAALEIAKREKEVVLDSISELVTFQDMSQRILWANRAAAESVGKSREKIIGRHCYEIWNQRDEPCEGCPLPRALRTCKGQEGEVAVPNGRAWFIRCYPVQDEAGRFVGVVELTEDVTDKRKIEAEVLKSKKLESVGILAGGIAHDYSNLLTVIMGNISVALSYSRNHLKIRERLMDAKEATMRSKDLIQKLFTFSRGGPPIKATASIAGLLRNTTLQAVGDSNITCEFIIPPDLWTLCIDEVQIGLVIHNMVMNAREAMPDGGTLKITAENLEEGQGSQIETGKCVKITIQDQGKGIPEEMLEKIFDPYFSTKDNTTQKGMGLGLSMSHSIVRQHNGYIEVNSQVGVGTTFHLYLPAEGKESPSEDDSDNQVGTNGRGCVIVMDEEQKVRKVTGRILNRLQFDVAYSKDGDELIDRYRRAIQSGRSFDAVIVGTPTGDSFCLNTAGTLQRLKEVDPQVKAIVVGEYADDPVVKKPLEFGFRGSLLKPYLSEELERVLKTALGTV